MSYPTAEDYVRAVQDPVRVFRRPELQRAEFPVHPVFGIPMPASGNAAVVFKARVADADHALRFFIRSDTSSHGRYTALGEHFSTHGLISSVATSDWVDHAITINGTAWPMLQMQWIDGRTLDSYVDHLAETRDVAALCCLAGVWRELVARMQGVEFAHGDLQHGNVLVDGRSALRLVDFDGSWISAFAGGPRPAETGHPNYQRTGRAWDRWMDTFPGLVIYTSLLALSREPGLWKELNDGENLIFRDTDYQPPFQTPVWRRLGQITDPDLAYAVARLQHCCAPGWTATESLETVLSRTARVVQSPIPPMPPPGVPDAGPVWTPTHALGSDSWWVETARGSMPPAPARFPPPPRPTGPAVLPPPPPKEPGRPASAPAFTGARAGSTPWYPSATRPTPPMGAGVTPRPQAVPAKAAPGLGLSMVLGILLGLVVAAVVAGNGASGGGAFLAWLIVSALITVVIHRARS